MTSGDGTAICSCFYIGHVAFRQQAHLIERDDLAVIGRRRWKTHHDLLHKHLACRVDDSNLFQDVGEGRCNGIAIEHYGCAGMSWQDHGF